MKEKPNLKEKLAEGHFQAILVIEIMGRPPKYVSDSLKLVIQALEKEDSVWILNKKLFKPKKVKEAELFSTFAEIEILAPSFRRLMELCLDYMPSSIEIIEPKQIRMDLTESTNLLNDLNAKLHKYDAELKRSKLENQILAAKLNDALEGKKLKDETKKGKK